MKPIGAKLNGMISLLGALLLFQSASLIGLSESAQAQMRPLPPPPPSSSLARERAQLELCHYSDAVCAGKVVLSALEKVQRSPGIISPQPISQRFVEFYRYSDCSSLVGEVRLIGIPSEDQATCELKGRASGSTSVYGVKEEGVCRPISGGSLLNVCQRVL